MPPLGQAVMASSLPVVIASNQTAVPVSLASVPLPAGAATEATLAAASAKLPASLGQKLMAASLAVVLASDQSALPVTGTFWQATQPVSLASVPLPTGAATEATLSAANAKLPASLGQKAMAASMAVVISSDQSAIPASQSGAWNIGTVTTVTTVATVTNLAQLGGNAISMNTGVRDAGTQRVTLATNDVIAVTQSGAWSLAANQSVNVAQMNGTAVSMGTGNDGAGVQRVVLASNVALPAGTNIIGALSANQTVNVTQLATNNINLGAGATGTGTQRITVATDCQVDTYTSVVQASGTITALDAVVGAPAGAGALVSGASTAGSLVFVTALGGEDTFEAHIAGGSFTATIYFEGSHNSTTGTDGGWIALKAQQLGMNATTIGFGSAVTNAVWRGSMSGFKRVRGRMVGAAFVSAPTVILRLSRGGGSVTLNDMLPTGTNVIGALVANQSVNVAQMNGVAVTMGSGVVGTGVQRVTLATDVALPVPATPTASAVNSAASTNSTNIKGSAGTVYGIVASNINAAIRYVKFYNKATAPTVGTDVPILVIPIPATSVVSINCGALGLRFGTGIGLGITTGAADTDTGAVAANEIKVVTDYV